MMEMWTSALCQTRVNSQYPGPQLGQEEEFMSPTVLPLTVDVVDSVSETVAVPPGPPYAAATGRSSEESLDCARCFRLIAMFHGDTSMVSSWSSLAAVASEGVAGGCSAAEGKEASANSDLPPACPIREPLHTLAPSAHTGSFSYLRVKNVWQGELSGLFEGASWLSAAPLTVCVEHQAVVRAATVEYVRTLQTD